MNYWESVGGGAGGGAGSGPGLSRTESQGATTTVRCRILEDKAAEYGIMDLRAFYAGAAFASARFTHDAERNVIVHSAA